MTIYVFISQREIILTTNEDKGITIVFHFSQINSQRI